MADLDEWSEERPLIGTRFALPDETAVAVVVDYFDGQGPAFEIEGMVTPEEIGGLYAHLARRQGWGAMDCMEQRRAGSELWKEEVSDG